MNYNEKYPSRRRSAGRVFAYFEILLPSRQAVNKAPESTRNGGDAHERYKHNVVTVYRFGHVVERYDKEVTANLVFPD